MMLKWMETAAMRMLRILRMRKKMTMPIPSTKTKARWPKARWPTSESKRKPTRNRKSTSRWESSARRKRRDNPKTMRKSIKMEVKAEIKEGKDQREEEGTKEVKMETTTKKITGAKARNQIKRTDYGTAALQNHEFIQHILSKFISITSSSSFAQPQLSQEHLIL